MRNNYMRILPISLVHPLSTVT